MTETLLHDVLIILSAGLVAGLICRRLRISVLIGYLVAGVLLGQGVLGWVLDNDHQIEHFAEAGVFLLLFSIGLEFSLDDLRRLGRNLFLGGGSQMLLVAVPVAVVLVAYGRDWKPAVLIGAAVAFSSTVLVFKALSEWGQSERSHGIRAIGILLFQDAALIPLLLMVPLLTGTGPEIGGWVVVRLAASSVLFVFAIAGIRFALARHVIPILARYRSPDLVILSTLVALGGVTLAAHSVGLPPAVGAFAAGLIFNGNRWTKQIDSLVLPFREAFAAIFFVSLGLILDPRVVMQSPLLMVGMLVAVIGLKTIGATLALRITGLPLRHAFGMGLGLAHVGEFAFVLVLLGLDSGVVSSDDYQRLIGVAVGSLILTPPLMKIGLRLIASETSEQDQPFETLVPVSQTRDAIVIGAGPIGRQMASQLEISGYDVCLIDLSPINLHPFGAEGFRTVAGDASSPETLQRAGIESASLIIVCVPDDEAAFRIVRTIHKINSAVTMVVRCRYRSNVRRITKAGANQVVSEESEASLALFRIVESLGERNRN